MPDVNFNLHYVYVDVFASRNGKPLMEWRRMHASKVREFFADPRFQGADLFQTIQRFSDPVHKDEESQYCPLYFDIDHQDLNVATDGARAIVDYFRSAGVKDEGIKVWFSGKKGYHIIVRPEVFSIKPHPRLYQIIRLCAINVAESCGVDIDKVVYSERRQWRLSNSPHSGSGLYCVELALDELWKSVEEIKALAVAARKLETQPKTVVHDASLAEWFDGFVLQWEEMYQAEKSPPATKLIPQGAGRVPECLKDLEENGLRKKSTGNKSRLVLATVYKDLGYTKDQALAKIKEFNAKQKPEMVNSSLKERDANAHSVVASVYDSEKYRHSCPSMLSLGTGTDKPIACAGVTCPFIKGGPEATKPSETVELPLHLLLDAKFVGTRVRTRVNVLYRQDQPFSVHPGAIVSCSPNLRKSMCQMCKISGDKGRHDFQLTASHPHLLEFEELPLSKMETTIKRIVGIPSKCGTAFYEYKTPRVNLVKMQVETPADDSRKTSELGYRHVNAKIYSYADQLPKANRPYVIEGYVMPHAVTGEITIVADTMKEDKLHWQNFQITKELSDQLKIFQGPCEQKMAHIAEDLEKNVLRYWKRRDFIMLSDLVFHSTMSFKFQNQIIERGWLELIVVGDSGQGKTYMVRNLQYHYNAGDFRSAPTVSLAGLLGGVMDASKSTKAVEPGVYPKNDGGMLIWDEIDKVVNTDMFSALSNARQEGITQLTKIVKVQWPSRVRGIFLANPRSRRLMGMYTFGCMAVSELFSKESDVRRFDAAIALSSNDVSPKDVNIVSESGEAAYPSPLCQSLVCWAWNLKPDQILWTPEAEALVLAHANHMADLYDPDIPIVEPMDVRLNLARLAVAAAIRTYNTKDGGKTVLVEEQHVEFIFNLLNRVYSDPAMSYAQWSRIQKDAKTVKPGHMEQARKVVMDSDNPRNLVRVMLTGNFFNATKIREACNIDERGRASSILSRLMGYSMVKQMRGDNYTLTENGIKLLKELYEETERMEPQATEFDAGKEWTA